jgi:hypothetical protein
LSYWDIGNLFEHCFDVKLGKWIHLGLQFQKLMVGPGWKCNNIKNGQLFSFRIFVYTNFKTNYEMGLKMIRMMCVLKFSKFSCFSTISFEISKGYIYIYIYMIIMHLRCGYTCIAFNTTLMQYHLPCVTSRAYIQESYSKPQIWRPISKPIFKDPHWRPISRLKYRNPFSRLPYKPNQPSKH